MNLNRLHTIYFLGIGGIGMSALARYFHANNKRVLGYDKTPSELTEELQDSGIQVNFNDAVNDVKNRFDKATTLIIYTPAVPKSNLQLQYFLNDNYQVLKRSEVLGEITKSTICLAIAGTHGKTTSTSILGHILASSQVPLTAFLGGISENYNSNLILKGNEVTVVEADEFDRSFLKLSPTMAAITSTDADHLDIYNTKEALLDAFYDFSQIPSITKFFVKKGLPFSGITFGIDVDADYSISDVSIKDGTYDFTIKTPTEKFYNVKFNMPGAHNLLNALVAFAMAVEYGCNPKNATDALASFKGVQRRFSYQIKSKTLNFIDDYAHHPEEIEAVFKAVKTFYPTQKNLVIFQPHLFSRTRDFLKEFAAVLSKFDAVVLLDIYPAREAPLEGISSQVLLDLITHKHKQLASKSELIEIVKNTSAKVLLTLGAGDIGNEVKHLKQALLNEV